MKYLRKLAPYRKAITATIVGGAVTVALLRGKQVDVAAVTAAVSGFLTYLIPNAPKQ